VFNGLSILIMFLNGMVFSTFALVLSFLAKSYTDAPRYNAYLIVPMSFLCNTFFSIDQMPGGFRQFINALPLSQASGMIRAISANGSLDGLFVTGEYPYGWAGLLILLAYLVVFSLLSFVFIYKKKNL
jgi:ABC-type polysaccharide/polyol phosphate export permease